MGIPLRQEHVTLLSDYDTESAYYIAYQKLFTNIRFGWESTHTKPYTLLPVVPTASAAQLSVAANLAIASAQSGTPTVLVDADLRSPSLQKHFGNTQPRGLSDLLNEGWNRPQALLPLLSETFVPQLRLLGAGSPLSQPEQSTTLLANRFSEVVSALRQALGEAEHHPSLVIFHAPPLLNSIDTAQISSLVDQTFLVIVNGHTTRSQARRAQEQLERAHAQLLGLVMLDI